MIFGKGPAVLDRRVVVVTGPRPGVETLKPSLFPSVSVKFSFSAPFQLFIWPHMRTRFSLLQPPSGSNSPPETLFHRLAISFTRLRLIAAPCASLWGVGGSIPRPCYTIPANPSQYRPPKKYLWPGVYPEFTRRGEWRASSVDPFALDCARLRQKKFWIGGPAMK
jgi:hypothetical protein